MSTTLKDLIHERTQLKSSLTRFETFIGKISSETSIESISVRYEKITNLLDRFFELQLRIENSLISESGEYDEESASAERQSFEDRFFDVIAKCKRELISRSSPELHNLSTSGLPGSSGAPSRHLSAEFSHSGAALPSVAAKLPPLKLPEFNGSYSDWQTFYDTFNALVHNNQSLNNVERFYYLQGSLKGEPATIIASIGISDANYLTAWDLLRKRYENKKIIINSHIREIVNLQAVSRESHTALRKFSNTFSKNYRALESMGEKVSEWSTILLFLLSEKLDFYTRKEWENHSKNLTSTTIDDFIDFINQRCQILENLDTKGQSSVSKSNAFVNTDFRDTKFLSKCPFCKEQHFIYFCERFKALDVITRLNEVKKLKLCSNCLRSGHKSFECRSGGCKVCKQRHSSLLHRSSNTEVSCNQTDNVTVNHPNENLVQDSTALSNFQRGAGTSTVLLSTAIVNAFDKNNQIIPCRVLLDNGSQSNFVTKAFAEKLQLDTQQINIPVAGIDKIRTNIKESVEITISSQCTGYRANLNFFVLNSIASNIPQVTFDSSKLQIPSELTLADSEFSVSSDIDMLLGCEIFFDLLCVGQIKLGKSYPTLQKTLLGWIVAGSMPLSHKSFNNHQVLVSNYFTSDLKLELEKFWEIEEEPSSSSMSMSKDQLDCEISFVNNTSRDESGRFVVHLPLKSNFRSLGDSEERALNRFYALEKRLRNSPSLAFEYKQFLAEYQKLGHMSEVDRNSPRQFPIYYLPHHGVEKPASTTTKLRVVFDASSKTTSNLSLNDVLKIGPTVQSDLFSVLLRFRQHEYVLIADISKMYRQVLVHESERSLQRILWRESPDQEVRAFELNTVTYGTASASFLATRCLKQIAIENSTEYPIESEIISRDFYVDDLLTGNSDLGQLIRVRDNISKLLLRYGFYLRKYQSNHPNLIENLNNETSSEYIVAEDSTIKTLGVAWLPSRDVFEYKSHFEINNNDNHTKRSILSFIAKFFDPLGLLAPIIIKAKILIQRLWQLKIGWDESLPLYINSEWTKILSDITKVKLIQIPRFSLMRGAQGIIIHGFCDASEKAYACCIYFHSTDSEGRVETHLVCAKSRVAPLKSISLPRLELCGAVLLSRQIKKCINSLTIKIDNTFLWTDSTIVLSWLSSEPNTWKTFVCNRVAEIQRLTEGSCWNHVSSSDNPADIISRGAKIQDVSKSKLYWHGPDFLHLPRDQWRPKKLESNECNESSERRIKPVTFVAVSIPKCDLFERYSCLNKLIRVTSYCIRFITNSRCKDITERFSGELAPSELDHACKRLIRIAQTESFPEEVIRLNANKPLPSKSKLLSLSPFVDEIGILRVGGRLKHSELAYSGKHPILLPSSHLITKLIIDREHKRTLHAGASCTLSHIRQNFWPINGRQLVRSYIRKCVVCFKANPRIFAPQMGELPKDRVTPSRPFSRVGIDYAGPFEIKDGKTRSRKIVKGYVCVFVCLSTKAVHLELITDLSSEGFLSLLRRFVSRRGISHEIYSDNATNFVGAKNQLIKVSKLVSSSSFKDYISENFIKWHFIPARSPHFGGIWEAAVKSFKHHFKRICRNSILNYEEFYTLMTQIEAILNSRPLYPMSSDPNDLNVITPGHFLIGQAITAVPDVDLTNRAINHVKRYQYIQTLYQHFWKIWQREYLQSLQARTKWKLRKDTSMNAGSLVLLIEDGVPPIKWPLARIIEVHPGSDGIARVVSLKTGNGICRRAVQKIAVLPLDCEDYCE